MTTLKNDFSGTLGATVSTVNSAAGGNAFDYVGITGDAFVRFDNHMPHSPTRNCILAAPTSGQGYVGWQGSMGSKAEIWGRAYVIVPSNPTSRIRLSEAGPDTSHSCSIYLEIYGTLTMECPLGTVIGTTVTSIPFNTLVRIEYHFLRHASAGAMELKIYADPDSDTATETLSYTGINTVGTNMTGYWCGAMTNLTGFTFYVDDYGISDVGWLGPEGAWIEDEPLFWKLEVDWDGDGTYTDESAYLMPPLRMERGWEGPFTPSGEGQVEFARSTIGKLSLILDNQDKRFSPYNAASPLYPSVQPGRKMILSVKQGSTGHYFAVFTGTIDLPTPSDDESVVYLDCSDGWQNLGEQTSTTALLASSTVDAEMAAVLTKVGWPAAWGSILEVAGDTVPFLWTDEDKARDVLHELAESNLGKCWIAADGSFKFIERSTVYGRPASLSLDGSQCLNNIKVGAPWDSVRNRIRVAINKRTEAGSSAVLWTYPEAIELAAGQSVIVSGAYQDADGVPCPASPDTPIANTDFKFNAQADGLGADMIASLDADWSLGASEVLYTLTNDHPTTTGYVTLLRVQGKLIAMSSQQAVVVEDAVSQAAYDIKKFNLNTRFLQSGLLADSFANFLLDWLSNPQPVAIVQLEALPSLQFQHDLATVLEFTFSQAGLGGNFQICKIVHESIGDSLQAFRTTWRLEPLPLPVLYFELGTAGQCELGINCPLGI